MNRQFSASSIPRVMACPGSEALPHVYTTSEFAEAGNARHTFLQFVRNGLAEALAMVPEKYHEMCEEIDLEGLPTDLASEVAFAWDWVTGEARELGRGLERDYSSCTETEVPGTIDALGVDDCRIYIGDYKGFDYVNPRSGQLMFAAMCAAKVFGISNATLETISIRNGSNFRSSVDIDAFDLLEFETALKATCELVAKYRSPVVLMEPVDRASALELVAEGKPFPMRDNRVRSIYTRPAVTEGPHCKYCPSFNSCPAKTLMIRNLLNPTEQNELELQTKLTPENATKAYEQLKLMESLVKRARSAVYAYAAEHPIDLGDGSVLGSRTTEGNDMLDGDVTYDVIREQFGQNAADIAVSRSATKTGIGKVIKTAKKDGVIGGTLKAATADTLDRIRQAGGISRKLKTTVDVHKAELPAGEQ